MFCNIIYLLLCLFRCVVWCIVFFFNVPATTEIYTYLHTLSLHDALPICEGLAPAMAVNPISSSLDFDQDGVQHGHLKLPWSRDDSRSEEHTSELQSLMRISYAVFCLKKKNKKQNRDNGGKTTPTLNANVHNTHTTHL